MGSSAVAVQSPKKVALSPELVALGLGAKKAPYDPTDEEPDFRLAIECLRQLDREAPHSRWRLGGTVEGYPYSAITLAQRHYVAAVLRHIAEMVALPISGNSAHEQQVYWARRRYLDARLALIDLADCFVYLRSHGSLDEQMLPGHMGRKLEALLLAKPASKKALKRVAQKAKRAMG